MARTAGVVDVVVLSRDEVDSLADLGIDANHVSLPELEDHLRRSRRSALVVVPLTGMTSAVAEHVCTATRRTGRACGMAPLSAEGLRRLPRLLQDSGSVPLAQARIGVASVAEQAAVFEEVPAFAVKIPRDRVRAELQLGEWTAIGLTTNGRMSYCQLGDDGWLHPARELGSAHVTTPADIDCRHWFLQSCHSPFVWPEFDGFVPLPVALFTDGLAATVVCSRRTQMYVPGLLALYVELLMMGRSIGHIVMALNEHCTEAGVDYDPFILIGNPECRPIVQCDTVAKQRLPLLPSDGAMETLTTVGRNLNFILHDAHFGVDRALEDRAEDVRHGRAPLVRDYAEDRKWLHREARDIIGRIDTRSVRLRAGVRSDASSAEQIFKSWNEHLSLDTFTHLRKLGRYVQGVFSAFPAYCYHLGEQLEHVYLPKRSTMDGTTCACCGHDVVRRESRYAGSFMSADYDGREVWVCSRCFVIRDMNPVVSARTVADIQQSDGQWNISVRYTNGFERPQWVFGFAMTSEAQNFAARCGPSTYRGLTRRVRVVRSGAWRGRLLLPGEEATFACRVVSMPDSYFCCQLETHVFVDFCWNWLGFAIHRRGMERFLGAELYRRQFERRS